VSVPIRGFSRLHRLTRERVQNELKRGLHPDIHEPVPPSTVASIDPPTRGGESRHPNWFQVRALVKRSTGDIDVVFLAEYPTPLDAINAASVYPFRAVVINKHSKQEFNNWKPFEQDA